MRLQKQLSRAVGGKEYPKYVLVIPPTTIVELKWKEGEELQHEVKQQTLIIGPKPSEEEALNIATKYARKKKI